MQSKLLACSLLVTWMRHLCSDAETAEGLNYGVLQPFNVCASASPQSPQVNDGVQDHLAWTVKSCLASPPDSDNLCATLSQSVLGGVEVFFFAAFAQSVDLGMLQVAILQWDGLPCGVKGSD